MSNLARSSLLALAFLSLFLFAACGQQPPKKAVRPPDVTVVKPVQREITKFLEYTGNTVALETVEIRARVAGFLQKMYFEPRAKVKEGDALFLIDPRQYEASVKEAQGKLDAKKASWKLAQTELQISQQLESKEAISALRLEKKVAERDSAKAEVDLAEADLDQAKLNLEWTQVTSPIKGRVSRNKVDIGNLVGATEKTLLTTVVDDDPIYAYFNVSELDLLPLLRRARTRHRGRPSRYLYSWDLPTRPGIRTKAISILPRRRWIPRPALFRCVVYSPILTASCMPGMFRKGPHSC